MLLGGSCDRSGPQAVDPRTTETDCPLMRSPRAAPPGPRARAAPMSCGWPLRRTSAAASAASAAAERPHRERPPAPAPRERSRGAERGGVGDVSRWEGAPAGVRRAGRSQSGVPYAVPTWSPMEKSLTGALTADLCQFLQQKSRTSHAVINQYIDNKRYRLQILRS